MVSTPILPIVGSNKQKYSKTFHQVMRPLTFSSQNIAQMIESIVIDPTDALSVVSGQESTEEKKNLPPFLMASDSREL